MLVGGVKPMLVQLVAELRHVENQIESLNAVLTEPLKGVRTRLMGKRDALRSVIRIIGVETGQYVPPTFDPTWYLEDGQITLEEALQCDDSGLFDRTSDMVELRDWIATIG